MIEYFSGSELARPILLLLLLSGLAPRERIRRSLRLALPYLGVLVLYAVYRASFGLIFGFDRFNTLAALGALHSHPSQCSRDPPGDLAGRDPRAVFAMVCRDRPRHY